MFMDSLILIVLFFFVVFLFCFVGLNLLNVLYLKSRKSFFDLAISALIYCFLGFGFTVLFIFAIDTSIIAILIVVLATIFVFRITTGRLFKELSSVKINITGILMAIFAILSIFFLLIISLTGEPPRRNFNQRRIVELQQLRVPLEVYFDEHNSDYPSVSCDSETGKEISGCIFAIAESDNPLVKEYMQRPIETIGTNVYVYKYTAGLSKTFMVYVILDNRPTKTYYCIDSTGKAEETTINPADKIICP